MLCFVRSPSSQCDTYQKLEIDIAALFYLLMDAFWLQPRGVGTVCAQWFRLPCNSNQFRLILGFDSFWVLWCWFGKLSWLENSGSHKMFVAVICHCAMHSINCQLASRTSSINSMLISPVTPSQAAVSQPLTCAAPALRRPPLPWQLFPRLHWRPQAWTEGGEVPR